MISPETNALVPVGFAPDEETAERWARLLEAAGIEAHIRIEDGAHFQPLGSHYGSLLGGSPFVYPVFVSRMRHRAARRALAGHTTATATSPITARSVAAAVAVLAGSMLFVLGLAWARGQ